MSKDDNINKDRPSSLTPIVDKKSKATRIDRKIDQLRTNPIPINAPSTHPLFSAVKPIFSDKAQPSANPFTSGAPWMGIFSRTRDIIAANFTELLDSADDPAKMIRLIILEMEETLVEVRASAARSIADQKELHRHAAKLDRLQADWGEKAQLALSKDREDLARAALLEKRKASDMAEELKEEIHVLDESLRAFEKDINKLQTRLREARSRQGQIAARLESAENRFRLRSLMTNERVDEALVRFDQMERNVDHAEGRADALNIGESQKSLADEFAALEGADKVDEELAEMKRALGKDTSGSSAAKKGE